MKTKIIDTQAYRKDKFFKRNQEIWKARFNDKWPLKKIADHFDLSVGEVNSIIATHKQFYKQEYD